MQVSRRDKALLILIVIQKTLDEVLARRSTLCSILNCEWLKILPLNWGKLLAGRRSG